MAEGVRIPVPPGAEIVQPYPVRLPQFEGPLDLLLHLIRKNEVDLRNIPVAEICRQYHEYLVLMQELDLEVAAEFLYVEALLVNIKSQMVLPRSAAAAGKGGDDPREDLVRRLLEYRKYKAVAESLHEVDVRRLGLWPRPPLRRERLAGGRSSPPPGPPGSSDEEGASAEQSLASEEEADLSDVSLFDLLSLFRGVLDRYKALHPPAMEISHQKFSIREKMQEMTGRIRSGGGRAALGEVFQGLSGRAEAIAVFLAVLELLRLLFVRAVQTEEFGEIWLEAAAEDLSLEGYEEAYR